MRVASACTRYARLLRQNCPSLGFPVSQLYVEQDPYVQIVALLSDERSTPLPHRQFGSLLKEQVLPPATHLPLVNVPLASARREAPSSRVCYRVRLLTYGTEVRQHNLLQPSNNAGLIQANSQIPQKS